MTGTLLVVSGDVPLMDGGTLAELAASHRADGNAVTVLTTIVADPTGYGRIVRDAATGEVARIVEEGDATDEERAITEINTGTYAFDADALRDALAQHRQGERPGRGVPHGRGRSRARGGWRGASDHPRGSRDGRGRE